MAKKSLPWKPPARKGNLVHHSKLTIEYFISVEEVIVNDRPRKALKYALTSSELPHGKAEFSALLPDLTDDYAMEGLLEIDRLWASRLCAESAVVVLAVRLFDYASQSTSSRTAVLDLVENGADPVVARKARNRNNKRIAAVAAEQMRRDVELILEVPDGRRSDYIFNALPGFHDKLKPLWQEARQIARLAQRSRLKDRREGWKSEVLTFFKGPIFGEVQDDLIERLDAPSNWSDELAATLLRHGAASKPYDIALEHAARLTGYPGYRPYALTLRQLKAQLRYYKKWLKSAEQKRVK